MENLLLQSLSLLSYICLTLRAMLYVYSIRHAYLLLHSPWMVSTQLDALGRDLNSKSKVETGEFELSKLHTLAKLSADSDL